MSSIVNEIKQKVVGTSTPQGQHLAALLTSKGSALERDLGFFIASYPAIPGSDVAGIVISAGSSVPTDAPKPGTRVPAFAPCFFVQGAPDYGALQTRVLVPAVKTVELPEGMAFNEASLLPMAVVTAWSGWYPIGLPRDTSYTAPGKQGMLVWGGASSISSAAIQVAKMMGFKVYTTASEKHHEYLKELGASKTFYYKDERVVENIIKAAKVDGVTIDNGFDAVGQLPSSVEILKALKGEKTAKLASATHIPEDTPKVEGVEAKFVAAPLDERERTEFFSFRF
ncbi:hypothetical protein EPUS_01821 [Endocarpon pusillum Z07020]|uniref:Enoyl reductase (ER) domain-containing protein n=1 Tax=Endocarpon pusillum (strain Z07020 / HMAS-L-300199) TaxID=1263415 RepID=U1FX91_ENDPU|nr:uncharacterized protein EPUS_01821 [Endocarpon pusillum Z07020]ERF69492.1 hypothetical protein EPUS_01821 [Endocarpon pusillum Z07020]